MTLPPGAREIDPLAEAERLAEERAKPPAWEGGRQFRDGIAAILWHAGLHANALDGTAAEVEAYVSAWLQGGHARGAAYLRTQYGERQERADA